MESILKNFFENKAKIVDTIKYGSAEIIAKEKFANERYRYTIINLNITNIRIEIIRGIFIPKNELYPNNQKNQDVIDSFKKPEKLIPFFGKEDEIDEYMNNKFNIKKSTHLPCEEIVTEQGDFNYEKDIYEIAED